MGLLFLSGQPVEDAAPPTASLLSLPTENRLAEQCRSRPSLHGLRADGSRVLIAGYSGSASMISSSRVRIYSSFGSFSRNAQP